MIQIKVKPLDHESFRPFGDFVNMYLDGDRPVQFQPDMIAQTLGTATAPSYSTCKATKREMIVQRSEYHSTCGEANLPLDGDIVIHVGKSGRFNASEFEAFYVPKGTMVVLKPGTYHNAPYPVDGPVNTLVVLPNRTFANDSVHVTHEENEVLELIL